jgi:AcrR family transcriptional regulator
MTFLYPPDRLAAAQLLAREKHIRRSGLTARYKNKHDCFKRRFRLVRSPAKLTSMQRPARTNGMAPTLQSLKSAQTRAKLIEATIRCIVRLGYANTTTPQVAAEAGLSRGAMLHHFENGAALIKAAIVELHEKRLRAFRRAADTEDHDTATLVRTYWKQVQKPAFIAFHELALAARSNADLARILQPLQIEFRERFNQQAVQLFPEWLADRRSFDLAMAFSQTMLEGMAIQVLTGAMDMDMVEPMLKLVEEKIEGMNPALRPIEMAQAS